MYMYMQLCVHVHVQLSSTIQLCVLYVLYTVMHVHVVKDWERGLRGIPHAGCVLMCNDCRNGRTPQYYRCSLNSDHETCVWH